MTDHAFISSCTFSYDQKTSTLRVKYVSGVVYEYKDVPENVYREMKAYQSKGSYLNYYVKGKYDFGKVETSPIRQ